MNILGTLIAAAVLSNVVVSSFAGIETSLDTAQNRSNVLSISVLTIVSTLISSILASVVTTYFLVASNLSSLKLLASVVVISIVAYLVTKIYYVINKTSKLDSYALLSSLITNNMILLVVLQSTTSTNILNVIVNSLGGSLGFFLVTLIMMGVELRLQSASIMPSFKGKPALLIIMGAISLIMIGLSGIV